MRSVGESSAQENMNSPLQRVFKEVTPRNLNTDIPKPQPPANQVSVLVTPKLESSTYQTTPVVPVYTATNSVILRRENGTVEIETQSYRESYQVANQASVVAPLLAPEDINRDHATTRVEQHYGIVKESKSDIGVPLRSAVEPQIGTSKAISQLSDTQPTPQYDEAVWQKSNFKQPHQLSNTIVQKSEPDASAVINLAKNLSQKQPAVPTSINPRNVTARDEAQYRSAGELASARNLTSNHQLSKVNARGNFGASSDATKSQQLPSQIKSSGGLKTYYSSANPIKEHPFKDGPITSRLGKIATKLNSLPKKDSLKSVNNGKGSTRSIKPLHQGAPDQTPSKVAKNINNIFKIIAEKSGIDTKRKTNTITATHKQAVTGTNTPSRTSQLVMSKLNTDRTSHKSISGLLSQFKQTRPVRKSGYLTSDTPSNVSSESNSSRRPEFNSFIGSDTRQNEKNEISLYHSNDKALGTPRGNGDVYDLLYSKEHAALTKKSNLTELKKTVQHDGQFMPSTFDSKLEIYITSRPVNLQLCYTVSPQKIISSLIEIINHRWTQGEVKIAAGKNHAIKVTYEKNTYTARVEALEAGAEVYTLCIYPESVPNRAQYHKHCQEVFNLLKL